jgi:hypothetical protein
VTHAVVGQNSPETVLVKFHHFLGNEIFVFNGGVVATFGDSGIQLVEGPIRVIEKYGDSMVVNAGEKIRGRMRDLVDGGLQMWGSVH